MAGESVHNHFEWWEFILLICFKLTMMAAAIISGHTIAWIWTGKWKLDYRTSI
jgi:hypothetical protein